MPVGMTGELIAGRYRMQKRLGAGGMATVFLARDERLEREVAIKRLHADSADDVARRFQREAKVGASLNHPNIVSVYDTVTDDEGVLIVMEYVPGHTLRDEIARGPIEPGRAIEILCAVASALDHAHDHGVVHRDVKPANVLIDDGSGQIKLADLGIATAAEHSRITHSGAVLGTASYMAPERLDGGSGDKDVDIYALAAVAFEMLSGRKAIEGSSPLEIARRVATAPPPDLREFVADAPEGAAKALERGLAKRPEERQASAGAIVRELSGAYAEQAKREQTRPAPAPVAAAAPAPIQTSTGNGHGNGSAAAGALGEAAHRPAPQTYRGSTRSRRWAIPAAIGLAAVLLLVVLVSALSSGGGGSDKAASSSSGDKQASDSKKKKSSQPKSQTPASGGSAAAPAGAAPAPSSGSSGAAADQSTPTGAVASFYKTSVDDPHAAWLMGTDNLHRQLRSEESFAAQESTLESIDFPVLRASNQTGSSASIQFQSIARHTTKTDRCKGTISVVKGGGGWLVDRLVTVTCTHGPPS
jgi:serine/threonine protein kinase